MNTTLNSSHASSPPISYGKDTYRIERKNIQSVALFGIELGHKPSSVLSEMTEDANKHCDSMGKIFAPNPNPENTKENSHNSIILIYSCVDKNYFDNIKLQKEK